jgi:hypothetical protein
MASRFGLVTPRLPSMPDSASERARYCSQCGQPVTVIDATFCKECGAALAGTFWLSHEITWRPGVALVLSIVPGLGHLYKRQPLRGIFWFAFVVFMYEAVTPIGLFLHAICAGNAALSGAIREEALSRGAGRRRLSTTLGPRS